MRRIFIKEQLKDQILLSGADAHHIKNVLRAKLGDIYILVDIENKMAEMEIVAFQKMGILFNFRRFLDINSELPIDIELVMCLPKADKMSLIVQKATELGLKKIQPVISDYSVIKYDEIKCIKRQAKWQKIAQEAATQAGRNIVPRVEKIMFLTSFLDTYTKKDDHLLLFCYEKEKDNHLKSALQNLKNFHTITILIGAEGGFSEKEYENILQKGAKSVSLGRRILRTETAAIATMSILQYECEVL